MKKSRAIALLGGTVTSAAKATRVSRSAVSQWPDELPGRIEDRVLAALARQHLRHLFAEADGIAEAVPSGLFAEQRVS